MNNLQLDSQYNKGNPLRYSRIPHGSRSICKLQYNQVLQNRPKKFKAELAIV